MTNREKVIKGLECCIKRDPDDKTRCDECPYEGACLNRLKSDALALLKAQEPTTIEPKRIELADETKAWLDKMDAVDALGNIANICIDWDGYRTADGLGGLINEIWAYARYCASRLAKAQEPHTVLYTFKAPEGTLGDCPMCGSELIDYYNEIYCGRCGQAVKWELEGTK